MSDLIEKGKWNVGDIKHAKNGNDYRVTGFNAKGEPLWSLANKKQGGAKQPQPATAKQPKASEQPKGGSVEETKPQQAPQSKQAPKSQAQIDAEYGAPKPTIQYAQAPDKDAPFRAEKTWKLTSNTKISQDRDRVRSAFAKLDEKGLLNILNNPTGNENARQIAYEEAAHRGIPEHKINVGGSLKRAWTKAKNRAEYQRIMNEKPEQAAEYTYNDKNLQGMDVEAFMAKFNPGDTGWCDKGNFEVQKEFNHFRTRSDRQRFDAMVDYVKRQDPLYADAFEQMRQLNGVYGFVMDSNFKSKDHSPMLVSAGAAGAGKTTGFKEVANYLGMEFYDDKKHKPGDDDYRIVFVDKDVEDEKELCKLIAEHNGKVLLFDDKDKLLTSKSRAIVQTMKAILDSSPDNRVFHNPITGKEDLFRGTLVFTTNKSSEVLHDDEDHKAIMSRGIFSDVHFTINESIDLLRERYKTMGGKMKNVTPQEEEEIRQYLFDFIEDNIDQLDPDHFTVRSFTNALQTIDASLWSNKQSNSSTQGSNLFGKQVQWKRNLASMLNKSIDIDIEKALVPGELSKDMTIFKQFDEATLKRMKELHKKDPKKFEEMFGEELTKFVSSSKESEKVEKSQSPDFGGMSLEEAENILFG